jgi:hypothetical protein
MRLEYQAGKVSAMVQTTLVVGIKTNNSVMSDATSTQQRLHSNYRVTRKKDTLFFFSPSTLNAGVFGDEGSVKTSVSRKVERLICCQYPVCLLNNPCTYTRLPHLITTLMT